MKENGILKQTKEMDVVCKSGQMVPGMTVSGRMASPVAMDDLSMPRAMSTKEPGKKTKPMASDITHTTTVADMRDNGCKINNTVKASKNGQMVQNMLVNTRRARSMAKVSLSGLTRALTKATFTITTFMAWESIFGQMAESSTETGSTIAWRAKEYSPGVMGVSILVSTKTIRNMVMESSLGPTDDATMANGSKASNTAKVST